MIWLDILQVINRDMFYEITWKKLVHSAKAFLGWLMYTKLVYINELNTIEFCNPEFSLIRNFIYYNDKEYFNVFETSYRNFAIKYDSEFDDCIELINEEV